MDFRPLSSHEKRKGIERIVLTVGCFLFGAYALFRAYQSEGDQGYVLLYLLCAVVSLGAGIALAARAFSHSQKETISVESGILRGVRPGFAWTLDLRTVRQASVKRRGNHIVKIGLVSDSNSVELQGYEEMDKLWAEVSKSLDSYYFREGESGGWELRGRN